MGILGSVHDAFGLYLGPGQLAEVTEAELVCLAVAQAYLGFAKESRWLRSAPLLVGPLIPRLLYQSEHNRRLRSLSGCCVALDQVLGRVARRVIKMMADQRTNASECSGRHS